MISTCIITYNEEEDIRACLESVKWADEIIIVDSKSTDRTIEICKEYTDKIFTREWSGYGNQKEYARKLASNSWVLNIDADERVSKELKDEILKSKLLEDAYYIPRRLFFLGKFLRFSGCDKQIRLFRKDKAHFSNDIIHEKVIVSGRIGILKNPILHYSYKNISDYFERFNIYSSLEAEKREHRASFIFQVFLCFFDFIKRYIFKLGFLDGIPGFLWALFSSFHRLVKYAKIWEGKMGKPKCL